MKRGLFSLALLASIVWFPWWCALLVGVLGASLFSWYIEFFIAGCVFDVLYGVLGASFFGLGISGALGSLVLLGTIEVVKKNLR